MQLAIHNLIMPATDTIRFQVTPDFHRQIEAEARRLNLSISAYFRYLHSRLSLAVATPRFDRHVREVFGKHGDLMRRLAK
jgi:hypothetical protein